MKNIINQLKRLLLIIASSSIINWILFIALITCLVLNVGNSVAYKIAAVFFALEVMLLNANRYEGF